MQQHPDVFLRKKKKSVSKVRTGYEAEQTSGGRTCHWRPLIQTPALATLERATVKKLPDNYSEHRKRVLCCSKLVWECLFHVIITAANPELFYNS